MSSALGGWRPPPSPSGGSVGRIIGCIRGERAGPTLICTGSLHGNEPAGVYALQRVVDTLAKGVPIQGEFIALTGNRQALAAGRRFIDRDLNRVWAGMSGSGHVASRPADAEAVEAAELLSEFRSILKRARGPVSIVDLHTTSGDSPPFATIGDTLRNRAFALAFGVPIVLGLEEHLDGTFLSFADTKGLITMGFEGGRHDDPASVDYLEACAWMALAVSGVVDDGLAPVHAARETLRAISRGVPRVLEVRYRHPISQDDEFSMEVGFASFQPVMADQVVARDRRGPVRTPQSGRLLMPLYQHEGDDGFFVMREFRPFWLAVSAALRRMRADALVHLLPGVTRDPERPGTVIVNRRTAKWYALEIFHLLGYRRQRLEGDVLVVTRRKE